MEAVHISRPISDIMKTSAAKMIAGNESTEMAMCSGYRLMRGGIEIMSKAAKRKPDTAFQQAVVDLLCRFEKILPVYDDMVASCERLHGLVPEVEVSA